MTSKSNPNPLFCQWLTEWRNGAKEVGSKMQFVYNKALRSLREYPNTLNTGLECKQLKGFGDKICKRIDQKLAEINGNTNDSNDCNVLDNNSEPTVCSTNREITDLLPKKKKRALKTTPNKELSPLRKVAKTKTNKTNNYIPSEGSGGYAILMALIKSELEDSIESVGKQELQNLAQEFSTASMSIGANGSHYSAWNSIKTLINKGLIERNNHRFAAYFLTQTGRDLALKLFRIYTEKTNNNISKEQTLSSATNRDSTDSSESESIIPESLVPNSMFRNGSQTTNENQSQLSSQTSHSSNSLNDRFCLSANKYEIVLCIDTREQASGVNRDVRKTALMSVMQENGVKIEMKTLSVGDFAWIAKEKVDFGTNIATINSRLNRKELILDYVIERKRIDDLASSLKDRRWDEQKYRLINCGVRKPSYIIEYFGLSAKRAEFGGIKCETLDQAITNAQVDGFSIKRCDSYDDTVRYLTLMTRYLESYFRDKTIYSCSREELMNKAVPDDHYMTYSEFGRNANKITNFTVKEMFFKHLLQFKGISVSKAKVIVEHYPTLQCLLEAFSIANTIKDKENMLSSLKSGLMDRNFGPNLSKKIYNHYSK